MKRSILIILSVFMSLGLIDAKNIIYVSTTGKNSNPGTKESPMKNIQEAVAKANPGDMIYVAAGNYQGVLKAGYVEISKPVEIYGGWSADFSKRDIIAHRTSVIPSVGARGTGGHKCIFDLKLGMPKGTVVIDGFVFDRAETNNYHATEGKPEGVLSGMMIPQQKQIEEPIIGKNIEQDLIVRNCVMVNSAIFAIQGGVVTPKGSVKILNNVIVASVYGGIEIWGKSNQGNAQVEVAYNTILFTWSRTKTLETLGYAVRCRAQTDMNIHDNILGLSVNNGVDMGHMANFRGAEDIRIDNNLFFLNRTADLCLPSGGGKHLQVHVEDFEDVPGVKSIEGNVSLTDSPGLKSVLNKAYLDAFLKVRYSEESDYDPNSNVNQMRSALGLNQVGTIRSKVTMFANRYPLDDAVKLFGAVKGKGAQMPDNTIGK